jgi:hypothetical protein
MIFTQNNADAMARYAQLKYLGKLPSHEPDIHVDGSNVDPDE